MISLSGASIVECDSLVGSILRTNNLLRNPSPASILGTEVAIPL